MFGRPESQGGPGKGRELCGDLKAGARGQTAFLTDEVPVHRLHGLCVMSHTSAQARYSIIEARDSEDTT